MDRDVQRPHDKLFRAVFTDPTEAAALLRAHLPESRAEDLVWSSLTLQDASFIDEQMHDSESDLLYAIERTAGDSPAWLYLLLEHQSKPDRWMPFRLLKYCCRIWDRDRRTHRRERELRPIVPMVFYQGTAPLAVRDGVLRAVRPVGAAGSGNSDRHSSGNSGRSEQEDRQ